MNPTCAEYNMVHKKITIVVELSENPTTEVRIRVLHWKTSESYVNKPNNSFLPMNLWSSCLPLMKSFGSVLSKFGSRDILLADVRGFQDSEF
jgi:hypothetical protein